MHIRRHTLLLLTIALTSVGCMSTLINRTKATPTGLEKVLLWDGKGTVEALVAKDELPKLTLVRPGTFDPAGFRIPNLYALLPNTMSVKDGRVVFEPVAVATVTADATSATP